MNSLLGDTFSRENNTHGSRLHDRDPQFASRILGAMTQSCYIGTRDIRSRVIRGPYCIFIEISVKFVLKGVLNNKSSMVEAIVCRRTGDKPLPELMMATDMMDGKCTR